MAKSKKHPRAREETNDKPSNTCLVVVGGPRFGEIFPLRDERTLVGSGTGAKIHFLTSLLSERHFLLTYRSKQITLKKEDGVTLVNNVPVEEVQLKDGDLISAGGIMLRYVAEGSAQPFYVGDTLFGRERRRYRRFTMISTAEAHLSEDNQRVEVVSVRSVGRGGVGLFCKEEILPGIEIVVSLYSKNADRVIVAESIQGTVVSTVPWNNSLFLLNIRFREPISSENQPHLYQRLEELDELF